MRPTNLPEPTVIPRSLHPVSRKNIDREALKVMHRLRDAGYNAYLVGGAVRDLFLHKRPKDFDISTNARPGQIKKLFRNSRIIGRRFRLVQVFFHNNKTIEVSTLRCSSEYDIDSNKVLPSNNSFGNEAEDAFRRDLTINSLSYEIDNFSIIDYTGGVNDLQDGIIRLIGDPGQRIIRDPVRMMRVIRHAARSGFTIEKNTWNSIKKHRSTLSLCPVSRIRDELFKDLRGGKCREWAILAIRSQILAVLLPFYEQISPDSTTENNKMTKQMPNIPDFCKVADRLQSAGAYLPDHTLLAMLLIPWAQSTFDLITVKRTGIMLFELSRKIRQSLKENLTRLGIKRATQENIASLLTNLSLFSHQQKNKEFPRKLTSKSYFKEGLQFYQIYQEASGGKQVADLRLKPPPKTAKHKKPSIRTNSRTPVFSQKQGGVFGFLSSGNLEKLPFRPNSSLQ